MLARLYKEAVTEDRYAAPARVLHWVMALGFAFMWVCGFLMENVVADESAAETFLVAAHVTVGVTLLFLLVLRIVVRTAWEPPRPHEDLSRAQRVLSRAAHVGLYGLPVLVIALGWANVDANGHRVHWFGLEMRRLFAVDEDTGALAGTLHAWAAYSMLVVAAIHAAAAFAHGRGVLRRMW